MTEDEYILTGGNIAARVVRIGATLRKPATIATPSVKGLLDFLHDRGYPASPQHLGLDEQGRQSLEFVPGVMANAGPPLSLIDLEKIGRLIRQLHDATACFPVPADAHWDVPYVLIITTSSATTISRHGISYAMGIDGSSSTGITQALVLVFGIYPMRRSPSLP